MTNRLSLSAVLSVHKLLYSSLRSTRRTLSTMKTHESTIKILNNEINNNPTMDNRLLYRNTLLVATTKDKASMNLATAMTNKGCFQEITNGLWQTNGFTLWIQNESLLRLDNVHQLCINTYNMKNSFDNVIFLSKHSAASGKPSLTIHPIGIPWQTENERSGGIPGKCSPPSFLISKLYNAMLIESKVRGLDKRYEVTMEATHHGPYVELPTCFVEIGSTELDWDVPEAGEIWADVLVAELGIDNFNFHHDDNLIPLKGISVVLIGGGHYVPKMNDSARLGDGIFCGHALASYSLEGLYENNSNKWKEIIFEAITSTNLGIPFAEVICLVDKKAFKAPYKNAITSYLNELNVKWTFHFSELKSLHEQLKSSMTKA